MNSTAPQTSASTSALPAPAGIWITEVFRLTRWELYLAWRRAMAKVLIILLVVFYAIVLAFVGFALASIQNESTAPETPIVQCPPDATECSTPTPQQLKQIQDEQNAQRAASIAQFSDPVTFPTSLGFAASFTRIVGLILICILAGALVGSEYGFGTQRLAFSRGTSRLQMLTAQTVALAVISMIVAAGMLVLATIVGLTMGPAFGVAVSAPSFGGWMEIIKFFFAFSFSLFVYTMVALAAATLGKSTAAGVGLALGVIVIELILTPILTAIGIALVEIAHNDFGNVLQHIPDWFLGQNVGALLGLAGQYPIGLAAAAPAADFTLARSLLVALAYCVVLFGGSYLLLSRRDVTE
ncbi:MAG TPA: ABC transporter permease subunit [Ktedonobacterales bacterium]|jgi:ABC-type transport system involved in multi-copper enzyme maturation permease subunit